MVVFDIRLKTIQIVRLVVNLKERGNVDVKFCLTCQHSYMLDQALDLLVLPPDFHSCIISLSLSLNDVAIVIIYEPQQHHTAFRSD